MSAFILSASAAGSGLRTFSIAAMELPDRSRTLKSPLSSMEIMKNGLLMSFLYNLRQVLSPSSRYQSFLKISLRFSSGVLK